MGCSQSTEAAAVGGGSAAAKTHSKNASSVNAGGRSVPAKPSESISHKVGAGANGNRTPEMAQDPLETSTHSQLSLRSFGSTQSNGKAAAKSCASTAETSSHGIAANGDAVSVSSASSSKSERRNPKSLGHSSSVVGLESMIENRRESNLLSNVVHVEVPFGKPIEEVYDGVHDGPVLGSGISGIVRLATHKATGVKYAVKCLDLGLVDNDKGLAQLREEIFIMTQLDHPNIVRLYEVYEGHSEIYLVQELCLGGELFDRLDEQPDYHYTEAECARLIKQMLCAVRYLHSRGIIHRDLKLENFLFSSTSADSELKMIDFGLSKHFRFGEVHHEAVGTPYTVAPEVIRGNYDERCDIWAIGVISFLLLSGDPPFGGCGGPEPLMTVRSNILKGLYAFEPADIWCLVSQGARDFIKNMLVIDPKARPTAQQAQQHPWLLDWANRSKTEDDNVINPNVVEALVNFKELSDMKKLLCEVLSFTLLPEQITDLRKEFEKMDTDGSGEISLSALKEVLVTNAGAGSLGALTEEEVEDIFNAMRVKKTETRIHWHEFIAAGLSQCQVDDRNLRLAFDRIDSDHKGYVTIEDVMDLLGSDSVHSEEMMRKMWGDSMKAANCNKSRITYDDFLHLMKGQNAEVVDIEKTSMLQRLSDSNRLLSVPEDIVESKEESMLDSQSILASDARAKTSALAHSNASNMMPLTPISSMRDDDDMITDTPLSMDADDDGEYGIVMNGQQMMHSKETAESAFRNARASGLTPPSSPHRGAADYISPLSATSGVNKLSINPNLAFPQLSMSASPVYIKKRSRSMGDDDDTPPEFKDEIESPKPSGGDTRDARRAVLLLEHTRGAPVAVEGEKQKTALQVNRQLYRTHRQMRLAVLEASKRFEEQQTRHAREVLIAQNDEEEGKKNLAPAGLVMRRGERKQVTSEAVSTLLETYRMQQEKLVEVANKRGGRGRRTRKKTKSDMSAMMGSLSQDELRGISEEAAKDAPVEAVKPPKNLSTNTPLAPVIEMVEPELRGATVPGNFKPVRDPFSAKGKYGR
mmetsp:Transcript_2897/g.8124  ORF Transcript_2897/g.8124 Transcript_2897/m.8124 type:complete len:1038 (+) Transcript_2897:205-3318(+)